MANYWTDPDPVAFRDWVVENDFSFMDFGCSEGNSMLQAKKMFEVRTEGLGIDLASNKLETASEKGLSVAQFDIGTLPDEEIVDFVTMVHFIEHLNGSTQAKEFIEKACGVARDFIFIRQPYFDADPNLFHLGLKCYWSDWRGHRFHMTSLEMYALLRDLKTRGVISDYSIHFAYDISDSSNPAIIPLSAGFDQFDYDESIHAEKDPNITFGFPVFREIRVIISFDPETQAKIEKRVYKTHTLVNSNGDLKPIQPGPPNVAPVSLPLTPELATESSEAS